MQISWVIKDPSDGSEVQLKPGDRQENYEANNIQDEGDSTYVAYMRMKEKLQFNRDSDKIVTFTVDLGDDKTKEIQLDFTIQKIQATEPSTVKVTKEQVTGTNTVVCNEFCAKLCSANVIANHCTLLLKTFGSLSQNTAKCLLLDSLFRGL